MVRPDGRVDRDGGHDGDDDAARTGVRGEERAFLPGARRERLLPLYDLMTRAFGIRSIHRRLVEQAALRPGDRVLDLGCGTGNLLLAAKAAEPGVVAVGVDPDLAALVRARRKARRRGLAVQLDRGYADELPYADGSLDVVLSSFVLHHVPAEQRETALAEVRRVLRPGGRLLLLDADGRGHGDGEHGGHGHGGHGHGEHGGRGHRVTTLQDMAVPGIPDLLRAAGFADVTAADAGQRRRLGRYTTHRAVR